MDKNIPLTNNSCEIETLEEYIMGKLDGKVAIITGAAQGMGAMHVRKFVEEGAKVAITDLNFEGAQKLAGEVGENTIALKLDVSSEENWVEVVAKTEEALPRTCVEAKMYKPNVLVEMTVVAVKP